MILAALREAEIAGARLYAACQVIGVSARTIQRWKRDPDGDDRRCGPRHRPGNALSVREETQVLALMTSAEYGHLSPKQLVPALADDGRYLASESTSTDCSADTVCAPRSRLCRGRTSLAHPRCTRRRGRIRFGAGTSRGCPRQYADRTCTST